MISYSICLCLAYFTKHNTLGQSILLQMAEFPSFLMAVCYSIVCVCVRVCVCILFIHSSVDGHLDCFPILNAHIAILLLPSYFREIFINKEVHMKRLVVALFLVILSITN